MTEVVIAKNIDIISQDEQYNYTIDLIDINTISFNIMNTDTGVNYKLYIKKDDEWCNGNLYKTQNDFGQLYKMINDCVFNKESIFKYDLIEEKENIKFNMEMKKDSPFFKLDLEFNLKKHISEKGSTSDKVDSLEYRFNIYKNKTDDTISQLKEDNELLKKQVEELIDFKLKLQEKNKKEYDWLNNKRTYGTELYDSDQELIKWYACPDFTQKRVHENTIYDPDRASPLTSCPGTFLEVLTKPKGSTGPEVFWKRWFRFHMEKLLI
jgi:hypothetical protein